MKRLSLLAFVTVMGIAGTAVLPAQAEAEHNISDPLKANGYVVAGGQVDNLDGLKSMLSGQRLA